MISGDLAGHVCVCGADLSDAASAERREMIFASGEFKGEAGVALEVACACGEITTIPWVANPRPTT